MEKNKLFVFINGIYNFPGDIRNWVGRAVTYVNSKTPHKAEKIEYFSSIITRALQNKKRAHKLYKTLSYYRNWEINLISHSNGADVIIDCLNMYKDWPNINNIHLVAPACERDFNKNNLNELLSYSRVNSCYIYLCGEDRPIKFTSNILGKILGYGNLGKYGPKNIDNSIIYRVKIIKDSPWDKYGHSDCFESENFEKTMELFKV